MVSETIHTRFSDIVLDDAKLSMAAKGVFVTVGFLGSGCSVSKLISRSQDAKDTIMQAVGELVAAGYVSFDQQTIHIRSAPTFGIASNA